MMMELKIRMPDGATLNEILLEWTMEWTILSHDQMHAAVVGTKSRDQ